MTSPRWASTSFTSTSTMRRSYQEVILLCYPTVASLNQLVHRRGPTVIALYYNQDEPTVGLYFVYFNYFSNQLDAWLGPRNLLLQLRGLSNRLTPQKGLRLLLQLRSSIFATTPPRRLYGNVSNRIVHRRGSPVILQSSTTTSTEDHHSTYYYEMILQYPPIYAIKSISNRGLSYSGLSY